MPRISSRFVYVGLRSPDETDLPGFAPLMYLLLASSLRRRR